MLVEPIPPLHAKLQNNLRAANATNYAAILAALAPSRRTPQRRLPQRGRHNGELPRLPCTAVTAVR